MASRVHSILIRFAVGIGVALMAVGGALYFEYTQPCEPSSDTDIFTLVEGEWAWPSSDTTCDGEWHRIIFTPDRSVMTIVSSKPDNSANGRRDSVTVWDIVSHTRSSIRGAIRGETRRTNAGKVVVWDLVLRGPNTFVWHRTDWIRGAFTPRVKRCPKKTPQVFQMK